MASTPTTSRSTRSSPTSPTRTRVRTQTPTDGAAGPGRTAGPRPPDHAEVRGMKALGKAAAVTAMAVALLVSGAVVFVRGTGDAADPASGRTTSSSLLLPTSNEGSLDRDIASLQRRLREIPEDWRGFAQLGLA